MNPRGQRLSAHPKSMQVLLHVGYVEMRTAQYPGRKRDEQAWLLTDAGHVALTVLGAG